MNILPIPSYNNQTKHPFYIQIPYNYTFTYNLPFQQQQFSFQNIRDRSSFFFFLFHPLSFYKKKNKTKK